MRSDSRFAGALAAAVLVVVVGSLSLVGMAVTPNEGSSVLEFKGMQVLTGGFEGGRSREGTTTVYYYDDTATSVYVWKVPQSGAEWFAERFDNTGALLCSLQTVRVLLHRPSLKGTPDVEIGLWSDDGLGYPNTLYTSVVVPYASIPAGTWVWVEADFSGQLIPLGGYDPFHIGVRCCCPWEPGDTLAMVSDMATGPHSGEYRCTYFDGSSWTAIYDAFEVDYVFMIEAVIGCMVPSVYVTASGPGVGPGDTLYTGRPVTFDFHLRNATSEHILEMSHGFRIWSPDGAIWDSLKCDTAGGLGSYLDSVIIWSTHIGSSSDDSVALRARSLGTGLPNGYDGIIMRMTTAMHPYPECTLTIDSTPWPAAGKWAWTTNYDTLAPAWEGPYHYKLAQPPDCCIGTTGNANGDANDKVDVSDLTYLIAYLFRGGPVPPCVPEADVNADGSIKVSDLTYLVTYLFRGGPAPAPC